MIYHYCNTTVFESIIATKQIWLTDITKLNDRTEYQTGIELILEILKERGLEEQSWLQNIHADKLNTNFSILVGCFSQEGDVGSQWSSYGDNTKGLSIGFDENDLSQYSLFNRFVENNHQPISNRIKIMKVHYDKTSFIKSVNDVIDNVESMAPLLKYQRMALELRGLAARYKDPYFKDERETRVVIELDSHIDDKYELSERVNAYGENTIYHKLLTSFEHPSFEHLSAIKEVIIGPNCPYKRADVEALLLKYGLPSSVRVAYSSGYNRHRQGN